MRTDRMWHKRTMIPILTFNLVPLSALPSTSLTRLSLLFLLLNLELGATVLLKRFMHETRPNVLIFECGAIIFMWWSSQLIPHNTRNHISHSAAAKVSSRWWTQVKSFDRQPERIQPGVMSCGVKVEFRLLALVNINFCNE